MTFFHRKQTYDTIYSIGSNCATAAYLNKHFLRATSGPFDWWRMENTFAGNFEWRARLICSRFEGFLQQENLELIPRKDENAGDPYFEPCHDAFGPGFYFPHDFPRGEAIAKNYGAVKAKYDRRIGRFYEKINVSRRVLLVWLSLYEDGCEPESIKRHCEAICQSFGKTVDFLLIWHDSSLRRDQPAERQMLAPNITLWRANIFREQGEYLSAVMGACEHVDPILSQYELAEARWAPVKTAVIRTCGRLLCSLIPVRTWRKRARRVFLENRFNRDCHRELSNRP